MAWYIAEKEKQCGETACVLNLCDPLTHPLGSALLLAVPAPGELGVFPVRWGCPDQQRALSIFSWSLCALHPSCLMDWVHLTCSACTEAPALGDGKSLVCSVPALPVPSPAPGPGKYWMDCTCSGEGCGMEPSPSSEANNCISQREWALMGSRIDKLDFGDYTSFFTNKKLISCVGSGVNIAMISSNLTSLLPALKTYPGI